MIEDGDGKEREYLWVGIRPLVLFERCLDGALVLVLSSLHPRGIPMVINAFFGLAISTSIV